MTLPSQNRIKGPVLSEYLHLLSKASTIVTSKFREGDSALRVPEGKEVGNFRSNDSTEIHCRHSPPERVQPRTLAWLAEDT